MELPSFYRIFFHIILQPMLERTSLGIRKPFSKKMGYLALLSTLAVASHAQAYNLLQLKQDVASFLAGEYSDPHHERVEINVGAVDNRLRIGQCDQPLVMGTQDSSGLGGNLTVNVQCKGTYPWSVHVPAQVHIFAAIPVAARALTRGDLVSAADISEEVVNISTIRQEFLNSPDAAIGKEIKRNINQGDPLRSANLDAPTAIKRGDMVALASSAGAIRVVTTGTAMSDGRIGQKIRIRNTQSARVVSARVTGPGQAQTE